MFIFALKRIASLIPTLLIIAILVFILIHMIPGDPAIVMLGGDSTEEELLNIRKQLGLDKPIILQFLIWLKNLLSGDLGKSIHTDIPVVESIKTKFPVTFFLTTFAMLFSIIIALPAGIISARFHNTKWDYAVMGGTVLGASLPGFWLGLMALLLFSVKLGWFPATGYVSISENILEGIRYLVLPSVTLGFYMTAVVARMTRSSMLEVLSLEYVTHARAKGLPEIKVILKHALKNAFAPTLTTIGLQYGMLLGGAVVTESVFSLPGLGRYLVVSIFNRDYPVVQGTILFIAIIYVIINLIVDLLYGFFDPRIENN